jgi:hypothetical protein
MERARGTLYQCGVDCGDRYTIVEWSWEMEQKAEAPEVVRWDDQSINADPKSDPTAEKKGKVGCNGQRASARDTRSGLVCAPASYSGS